MQALKIRFCPYLPHRKAGQKLQLFAGLSNRINQRFYLQQYFDKLKCKTPLLSANSMVLSVATNHKSSWFGQVVSVVFWQPRDKIRSTNLSGNLVLDCQTTKLSSQNGLVKKRCCHHQVNEKTVNKPFLAWHGYGDVSPTYRMTIGGNC